MNLLLAITGLLCLIALYSVAMTLRHLRYGRLKKAGTAISGGVLTGVLAAFGVLIATSYLGYARLTDETRVGEIEFVQLGDDTFEARLMVDGERDRIMTLSGDEWQLDARIISWTAPFTLLGLEPIYALERLSGRYTDVERERSQPRSVHGLSETGRADLWSLANDFPMLVPGVDAYYGTAAYLPMAPGARYEIRMTRNALIARPLNDAANEAVGRWDER